MKIEELQAASPEGTDVLTVAIPCRAGMDVEQLGREAASAVVQAYGRRFGDGA